MFRKEAIDLQCNYHRRAGNRVLRGAFAEHLQIEMRRF